MSGIRRYLYEVQVHNKISKCDYLLNIIIIKFWWEHCAYIPEWHSLITFTSYEPTFTILIWKMNKIILLLSDSPLYEYTSWAVRNTHTYYSVLFQFWFTIFRFRNDSKSNMSSRKIKSKLNWGIGLLTLPHLCETLWDLTIVIPYTAYVSFLIGSCSLKTKIPCRM